MYICKDCFLDEELRSEINANAVINGVCDVCGKLFLDENGENEVSEEEIKIPEAHEWNTPTYDWSGAEVTGDSTELPSEPDGHTVNALFAKSVAYLFTTGSFVQSAVWTVSVENSSVSVSSSPHNLHVVLAVTV